MKTNDDFHARYYAALRSYLTARDEAVLAIAEELGRQALRDRISVLEIIEAHYRLTGGHAKSPGTDEPAALQFLMQTLAPLDVATRGFLDGTKRYNEERARAESLAVRDEFRSALVNSLQEGFFVADRDGAVIEINDAFAQITGYSADGLPYRWPHPWVSDKDSARQGQSRLQSEGSAEYESAIRHRDGHPVWVAISINTVTGADRDAYVGTIRDITAARAAAARERETSLTLQRAMLPPMETPAGFAVRYEPAVPPLEIGGDWYDVVPVGEHRIGIVVGDCVGRGLPAAAVMGQLRSSARALLLTGADPAVLLEQLDGVAELIPGAYCATVLAAIFDTESRVLTYSSAGHVPAVLANPESASTVMADAGSVPLAVQTGHDRPQASVVLTPGSTLMMFTDGLVERRGESIDDGIARVADIMTRQTNSPIEVVAEVVLRELAPPGGYDDDVAIVVCRPPVNPLCIDDAAAPSRLAAVRRRLNAWLRVAAVPRELAAGIVLAVGEACTNSIEHAYRDRAPGALRVQADIDGNEIRVSVVDFGSWQAPPAEPCTRGRGLPLIRALSDEAHIDSTAEGTTVAMSFRFP